MIRKSVAVCAIAASVVLAAPQAQAAQKSIAVVNCALIDDNAAYNDAEITRTQNTRLEHDQRRTARPAPHARSLQGCR